MKNGEQGEESGGRRTHEGGRAGFERRPGAAEICAFELSRLRHAFQSLILFAVTHGCHNRVDLRCPPKK